MTVAHWRFVAAATSYPTWTPRCARSRSPSYLGQMGKRHSQRGSRVTTRAASRAPPAEACAVWRRSLTVTTSAAADSSSASSQRGLSQPGYRPSWKPSHHSYDATSLESLIERALGHGGPYAALAVAKVVPPPRRYDLLLEALDGTSADPLLSATEAILDAPDGVRDRAWAKVRVKAKTHDRKQIATTLSAMAPLATSLNRRNVLESAATVSSP